MKRKNPWLTVVFLGLPLRFGASGEQARCWFEDVPSEVEEGKPFVVDLHYEVPSEVGEVPLHCEMKNRGNIVLKGKTASVSQKGVQRMEWTSPPASKESVLLLAGWMGEHWTQSICPIVHTEEIVVVSEEAMVKRRDQKNSVKEILERLGYEKNPGGNAALFWDQVPGFDEERANNICDLVEERGISVSRLDVDELSNSFLLTTDRFQSLLLTNADATPKLCARSIQKFAQQGGRILALGVPAFRWDLYKMNKVFLTEELLRERLAALSPSKIMIDFAEESLESWERGASDMASPFLAETTPGHEGRDKAALHVHMPKYGGWDGLRSPVLGKPFAEGATLTCFWAKGAERTQEMSVEWVEEDGSRWIASVPLSQEWTRVVILPEEFEFWKDCPAKDRGGPDDRFRPKAAKQLALGLADTHNALPHGKHGFWVEDVSCAKNPLEGLDLSENTVPAIEGLCPRYKFYPCRDVTQLSQRFGLGLAERGWGGGPLEKTAFLSHHPRPQGAGYLKERRFRWIPLLQAEGPNAEYRGSPAAAWVSLVGPSRGGVVVSVTVDDPDFYRDPNYRPLLKDWVDVLYRPFFLAEGGAEFNAYFWDEKEIRVGAALVGSEKVPLDKKMEVRIELEDLGKGEVVLMRSYPLSPERLRKGTVEEVWKSPEGLSEAGYRAVVGLFKGGKALEQLEHDVLVWKPNERRQYMTASKGQFQLGGKPWYSHGINYMPSTGIATEDGEYFEYWLEARSYDPTVVERDLRRIKDMKMNMVSVFIYHRSLKSRNLLDLLCRCEKHGLKVNLSLRPGTPMDFRWEEMREIIEAYRLPLHDNLFAYDLAWEPVHGRHEQRRTWDEAWIRWVEGKYGSVGKAETSWGVPMPREEGKLTNPTDKQVSLEGPWKEMVLDYRRFLNGLLKEKYGEARNKVRSVDPHHLVSFRMNVAGDPTVNPSYTLAYDFRGLAGAVDLFCPEGYGRIGNWERVKEGAFTVALARMADPEIPVLWAEFGMSVWDRHRERPSPQMLETEAKFYEDFYEMTLLAGANGTVCWFYPGGFRAGENSDFGIINPDGTWRPVSHVISEFVDKICKRKTLPVPEETLSVNLDAYASGIYGLYRDMGKPFWDKTDITIPRLEPLDDKDP